MICIPAAARTRSSLVAGIFVACGAWCGEDSFSKIGGYRTRENRDVIEYLNTERRSISSRVFKGLRKLVEEIAPPDRVVIFKYDYSFDPVFRRAFPEATFYFVSRDDYPRDAPNYQTYLNKCARQKGSWMNSNRIIERDFSVIRAMVEANGLVWNRSSVLGEFNG